MKKLLLLGIIFSIGFAGFSQNRALLSKEQRNHFIKRTPNLQQSENLLKAPTLPSYKSGFTPEETMIGNTRYDLQTNTSCQNRFHVFDDGTMGATWTYGINDPNFSDRGTGYNYFDGSAWGPAPTVRIESIRTGWPSYAPYGENGEIVVSHDFALGQLRYMIRDTKGTGTWSETVFEAPVDQKISWPRATTSGINHNVIQMLAITWPEANTGTIYEGLDGALLYSRSTDGGSTWDPQNVILNGLNSNYYTGFSADMYEWATSNNDNIAFLVGDAWRDFVLMKSTDGGDTWNKTVIWECPYPLFNPAAPFETDTFYCVDGAHHLAFDSEGKVHVVFGINRARGAADGTEWYPFVDGVGYWNESRPTFSNSLEALNPYGEDGSELVEDYSLIGWMQDTDGNDTLDILTTDGAQGLYYIGASSMPQITITENDEIYIVYSSTTEYYNDNFQNYRHLWARYSPNGDFWGKFVDLNADLIHTYDECVFPSLASKSDDYFYLIYQTDDLPGLAVRGDLDPYSNNTIWFMKENLDDIFVGNKGNLTPVYDYDILQNYPNPASDLTIVKVNIRHNTNLTIDVVNMLGQKVMTVDAGRVKPGMNQVELNVSDLSPGTYFYTVRAGEASVTKKMLVE
jgi:hypothetical protein